MQKNTIFIKLLFIPLMLLLIAGNADARYSVSGLVEFTYRDYETKVGESRSHSSQFTQRYNANLSSDIYVPRFLRLSGGIGYAVYHDMPSGQESDALSYNVNLSFFPTMKYSWDIFGSKSESTIQSASNIAGYDVSTTSYGGTLRLNLSRGSINGNGNNDNNSRSFSNSGQGRFRLPDITLSRIHTEAESVSLISPLKEQRDNTSANMVYLFSPYASLDLYGTLENYQNDINGSSYDTKTVNLNSKIAMSPRTDLNISGRRTEQDTANFTGQNSSLTASDFNVLLNMKEQDKISQNYRYQYSVLQQQGYIDSIMTLQQGSGGLTYRIIDSLRLRAGLDLRLKEMTQRATPTALEQTDTIKTAGVSVGVIYTKLYTPDFLGPFGLNTGYDFTGGVSDVSSSNPANSAGNQDGRGLYYGNGATIGLKSIGWKDETASLDYMFSNRRDHSAVGNNSRQETYLLNLSTRRIPKTNVSGNISYIIQEMATNYSTLNMINIQNSNTQRRSLNYSANVTYTAMEELRFMAGVYRGQSSSQQNTYTLAALPSSSSTRSDLEYFYGSANYVYAFTRNLQYSAELREEYRVVDSTRSRANVITMNVNYRIRSIFASLEWKWREDMSDNAPSSQQTYYYARLSRPF